MVALVVVPVRDGVHTRMMSIVAIKQSVGDRMQLWSVSKPVP